MSTRTYQFGKHRPTGLVGRRDLGEQVVLGCGAGGGIMLGFLFNSVPVLAGVGLALPIVLALVIVYLPYRPKGTSQRRSIASRRSAAWG